MEIKKATFVISNTDYRKCPDTGLPEYAFIGRSNVGKSSLINMLTGVKGLAKTSEKPGKTQLINHFLINGDWYLVDLPGYGYARTSKSSRERWQKMIVDYILKREQLVNVFVLVDSRIPPQAIDLEFINFLGQHGVPLIIVFTKIDKQKQGEVARVIANYRNILSASVTRFGRDRLLDRIAEINQLVKDSKELGN